MNYFVPVMVGAADYNVRRFSNKNYNNNNNNHQLGYYLAGLWEGDGYIWIPKNSHSPSGKKYTAHFEITFDVRDRPLAEHLKSIFGGHVRTLKDVNACRWIINSKDGLFKIIELINGKIRTPKITKFNEFVVFINTHYNSNFISKPLDTSSIINNAWLSGFIDADGSFSINIRQKSLQGKGKNRVESRFRIEQRIKDPVTGLSYYNFITEIINNFNNNKNNPLKLRISKHNEDKYYYLINVSSPKRLLILISYLDKYPLWSSKRINYLDFRESVIIILDKVHLKSKEPFMILKSKINNQRQNFDFSNLKDLDNY